MKAQSAAEKVADARMALVRRDRFFARLALEPDYVEAPWIQTMATDGATIFYNADFVERIDFAELVGVVAHEGAHNGFGDHVRRGARDPLLWNMACDYRINPMVRDAGLSLPAGALFDPRFDVTMTAEQIYKVLERERHEQRQGGKSGQCKGQPGQGAPGQGKPEPGAGEPQNATSPDGRTCPDMPGAVLDMAPGKDGNAPSPADVAAEMRQAQVRLAQAIHAARQGGKLPAGLARQVAAEQAPKVDWRAVLQDWCHELATSDYSWRAPNRGYLVEADIYAPSARERVMGPLVVAADVSGSVSDSDFRQFAGELAAVHASLRPSELHALQFDTKVQRHDTYGPDEQLRLRTRHASGGTAFQPIFDYIADKGIEPVGVVVLTDLANNRDDRPRDPGYAVLWVSTDPRQSAPAFGQRVDLL